jgi:hypothetical protein
MIGLQTPKTALGERFDAPLLVTRIFSRYLLGTALAALVIVASVLLIGHYGSQRCWDGKGVLTEEDARACARR